MLDKEGSVIASIRNFVIRDNGYDSGNLLFACGKQKDQTLDIVFTHPFSPVQAFALGLCAL